MSNLDTETIIKKILAKVEDAFNQMVEAAEIDAVIDEKE